MPTDHDTIHEDLHGDPEPKPLRMPENDLPPEAAAPVQRQCKSCGRRYTLRTTRFHNNTCEWCWNRVGGLPT
jgi:hypothetical protein